MNVDSVLLVLGVVSEFRLYVDSMSNSVGFVIGRPLLCVVYVDYMLNSIGVDIISSII